MGGGIVYYLLCPLLGIRRTELLVYLFNKKEIITIVVAVMCDKFAVDIGYNQQEHQENCCCSFSIILLCPVLRIRYT